MPYYNVIKEIWKVSYTKCFVLVFRGKWVGNKSSIKIDELGMTLVYFQKIGS